MTNAEKFEEVFGFKPNKNLCYAPEDVKCPTDCDDCPYISWLNEEYNILRNLNKESERRR